jgi:hemerythrin-like domain-containing protein
MPYQDPIQLFMDQHQEGLKQLEAMGRAARGLMTEGYTPKAGEAILRARDFIATEVKHHNQMEEEALFPFLEASIGPAGPVAVMKAEHRQLWEGLDRLEIRLAKLRNHPENKEAVAGVAETAESVVSLLTQHIHKEDTVLYPLARRILKPEDMEEVFRRMDGMRTPQASLLT